MIIVPDQSIDEARIEVVARPDGRNHLVEMRDRYLSLDEGAGTGRIGSIKAHGTCAIGTDEELAIRANVLDINLARIGGPIEVAEVLGRPSDDGREPKILLEILSDVRDILDVTLAEVDVIIKDGSSLVSSSQEGAGVLAKDRIDGKERAIENHILGTELNIRHFRLIQLGRGMILIEFVLRIAILVEKSEREVALRARIDGHEFGRDIVLLHESSDDLSDVVVAGLGDHLDLGSSLGLMCFAENASQTDHRIECRTSRHGLLRLVIAKDDVEDGLAYTYYITHDFIFWWV